MSKHELRKRSAAFPYIKLTASATRYIIELFFIVENGIKNLLNHDEIFGKTLQITIDNSHWLHKFEKLQNELLLFVQDFLIAEMNFKSCSNSKLRKLWFL